MTFKGQIKVIEFSMGCIFWMVPVMTQVYMVFSWPHDLWPWITFKSNQIKYNWIFNELHVLSEWCMLWARFTYNTYSKSHIWSFSWPYDLMTWDDLRPWMTFICQIKVFECLVGCISWMVHAIIWICVNNEPIWLPGNYGSDFEQYLTSTLPTQFHFWSIFHLNWHK